MNQALLPAKENNQAIALLAVSRETCDRVNLRRCWFLLRAGKATASERRPAR
jgi:hypothetical protein